MSPGGAGNNTAHGITKAKELLRSEGIDRRDEKKCRECFDC